MRILPAESYRRAPSPVKMHCAKDSSRRLPTLRQFDEPGERGIRRLVRERRKETEMGLVTIIVLGVVAITVVSVLGDMATKMVQAKTRAKEVAGAFPSTEIESLKNRLTALETRVEEREESVRRLQDEVRFVSRILEDKSGGHSGK